MSKSSRLLRLDPFAAALAKKEEAAKAESLSDAQEKSSPPAVMESSPSPAKISSPPVESNPRKPENPETRKLEIPKTRKTDTPLYRRLGSQKSASSSASARIRPRDGQVNICPDLELLKEIRHFLIDKGLNMREFFEFAARHYMDDVARQLADPESSNPALNDLLIIFKTHEDIIRLYTTYTGNRWKLHDDEAAHGFNGADLRYLEIGILNTFMNFKGKRINSFKYFVPEIEEALAVPLGDETVEILLTRRRQQREARRQK